MFNPPAGRPSSSARACSHEKAAQASSYCRRLGGTRQSRTDLTIGACSTLILYRVQDKFPARGPPAAPLRTSSTCSQCRETALRSFQVGGIVAAAEWWSRTALDVVRSKRLPLEEWADLDEDVEGELVDGALEEEEVPSFLHEHRLRPIQ